MSERQFTPKFAIPKGARRDIIDAPIRGMEIWQNKGNEFVVAAVHYTSDPEKRSEEWFRNATRGMREDQIQREYEIDFESRAGQKVFWYLAQNPSRWRIPNLTPKDIPKNWRIIAGLDYGSLNPTAITIFAVDELRRFYALYEFYKPAEKGESMTPEIVEFFNGTHKQFPVPRELIKRLEKIVADPAIFRKTQDGGEEMRSIADILEDAGGPLLLLEPGENDRQAGLERLQTMLRYLPSDPDAEPWLFFCERCTNLWKELNELVYDELPPHLLLNKNKKEDVVAKNDHQYDLLRYSLLSITAPSGKPEKQKAPIGSLESFEKEMFRVQNKEGIL